MQVDTSGRGNVTGNTRTRDEVIRRETRQIDYPYPPGNRSQLTLIQPEWSTFCKGARTVMDSFS
jgi:hypothetical protein